jgi:putative heme iron utilization protein
VTPACAPDLSLLLLLSDLSEHTRHLRSEPRCSVLVTAAAEGTNPQTAPRVTVTGIAEMTSDDTLSARYLAVHPYAAQYAGFGDFHIWRIRPLGALFVGGFARAVRLRQADLAPASQAVDVIAAAEREIIDHCNNDHPDALTAIAGGHGGWRMVTADVDGTDLALEDRVVRFHWSEPVADAISIRTQLVRMTREARARTSGQ